MWYALRVSGAFLERAGVDVSFKKNREWIRYSKSQLLNETSKTLSLIFTSEIQGHFSMSTQINDTQLMIFFKKKLNAFWLVLARSLFVFIWFLQACDAWKREATDSQEKAKHAEVEKNTALQRKEEVTHTSYLLSINS